MVGTLQLTEKQRQEVKAAAVELRETQLELQWKRREAADPTGHRATGQPLQEEQSGPALPTNSD